MSGFRFIIDVMLRASVLVTIATVVFSCAQPVSPQGGPKDEIPPEVARTSPENQSLNVNGKSVKIVFNEPIRKPTYDQEIFISPFVKRPKLVLSDNAKRLSIQFVEPLRPQTTYVITLTEVKDLNESNPMKEAFTLAFSTGDVLDSLEIKGNVVDPVQGKGAEELTMMLFDADSIRNNDFKGKRPAYITKTDASGDFEFKYLRNTQYKILGVKDTDQSNSYTLDSEVIAASEDTLITFPDDTSNFATVKLFAFLPDDLPPRLRNYAWLNPTTLAVRFNENLRLDAQTRIFLTDTLNQDSVSLTDYTLYSRSGEDPELIIHMLRDQLRDSDLHLVNIHDSLNNRLDSVLRIGPNRTRDQENPLFVKPELDLQKEAIRLFTYKLLEEADEQWISLTDTARNDSFVKVIPISFERKAFEVFFKPDTAIDPEAPYILKIDGRFFESGDSSLTDSIFRYPIKWFDPEAYGKISGKVRFDSTYSGPIVMEFMDSKKKVIRTSFDTTFAFSLIPPESCSIRVILDRDSNQVWTPGSLFPIRLPERIYIDPQTISIRANWDFEDHIVQIGVKAPEVPADSLQNDEGTQE